MSQSLARNEPENTQRSTAKSSRMPKSSRNTKLQSINQSQSQPEQEEQIGSQANGPESRISGSGAKSMRSTRSRTAGSSHGTSQGSSAVRSMASRSQAESSRRDPSINIQSENIENETSTKPSSAVRSQGESNSYPTVQSRKSSSTSSSSQHIHGVSGARASRKLHGKASRSSNVLPGDSQQGAGSIDVDVETLGRGASSDSPSMVTSQPQGSTKPTTMSSGSEYRRKPSSKLDSDLTYNNYEDDESGDSAPVYPKKNKAKK